MAAGEATSEVAWTGSASMFAGGSGTEAEITRMTRGKGKNSSRDVARGTVILGTLRREEVEIKRG